MSWVVRLMARCLCAAILFIAAPVLANAPANMVCHASAGAGEDYAVVAATPARWTCAPRDWPIAAPRAYLRFDLRRGETPPGAFITRLTRFDSMAITAIGADGSSATRELREAGMMPATTDWLMWTRLPALGSAPATVIVRVDRARHEGLFAEAALTAAPSDTPASLRSELLIAMLCGMLVLPFLFNFAFFRILRERFLLWHALAVAAMLAQTLVTSGLINRFAQLSIGALSVLSAVSWAVGIGGAALFFADFIEVGKIDARHRTLLRLSAAWVAGWTAFYLLAGGDLRPIASPAYLLSFVPLLALFIWVMAVAVRRRSRAIGFQIAAWLPLMLTGVIRIASGLGATDAPLEMQFEQHASLGLEVIITALGVADRFMMIRRERDRARLRSRQFEEQAERDALTGLLNRGAVERRFDELQHDGFRTMAVIDLDKFKTVNDNHGHVMGDAVLRAAALALEPDADTLVVRMGGEEFLLLLRGRDAVARAERRRQAIPTRISATVPGLDRLVTASMGLVEQPAHRAIRASFAALYGHCDKLLYEAKHAGRNRTMRERMQSFSSPRAGRAA